MLTGICVLAARLLAAVCLAMVGNVGCGCAARAGRRVRALAGVSWHCRCCWRLAWERCPGCSQTGPRDVPPA